MISAKEIARLTTVLRKMDVLLETVTNDRFKNSLINARNELLTGRRHALIKYENWHN